MKEHMIHCDFRQGERRGGNERGAAMEWRSGSTCLTSATNSRNMNQTIWVQLCPSDYSSACSACACVGRRRHRYMRKCHKGKQRTFPRLLCLWKCPRKLAITMSLWRSSYRALRLQPLIFEDATLTFACSVSRSMLETIPSIARRCAGLLLPGGF